MSAKPRTGRVRQAYKFIEAHRKQFSVQQMCQVLEVAPSGFYDWLKEPLSKRAQEDARLLRLIRASFNASHGIYGAPRVFLDLREAGETCSKHRVARLMRENGLKALHGYRTRRISIGKPSILIPNVLQRQFTVSQPNKVWVMDITYSTPSQRSLPGWGWKLLEHAWNAMCDGVATASIALLSLRKGVSRSGGDLLTLAR
jgi:putative transposase